MAREVAEQHSFDELSALLKPEDRFASTFRGSFDELPKWARETAILSTALDERCRACRDLSGWTSLRQLSLPTLQVADGQMDQCDLTACNLEYSGFTNESMVGVKLDHANLRCATMWKVDLTNGSIKNADLSQSYIRGNFAGCDFAGSKLPSVHLGLLQTLIGADVSKATFAPRSGTLGLQDADEDLNHVDNRTSSLHEATRFSGDSKITMVREVLHPYLGTRHIELFASSIARSLLRDGELATTADPTIAAVRKEVLDHFLGRANSWISPIGSPNRLLDHPAAAAAAVEHCLASAKALKPARDDALNQVLTAAGRQGVDSRKLHELRTLQFDALPQGLRNRLTENGLEPQAPTSSPPGGPDADMFLECSADRKHCIVFDASYNAAMHSLMGERGMNRGLGWASAFRFDELDKPSGEWSELLAVGQSGAPAAASNVDPVAADLERFSLGHCYRTFTSRSNNDSSRAELFSLITANSGGPKAAAFLGSLEASMKVRALDGPKTWLTSQGQSDLGDALRPLVAASVEPDAAGDASLIMVPGSMTLAPEHRAELEKHFADAFEAASPEVMARHMLGLATTFIKLSSSSHWGVEGDSPAALRTYSAALLQAARDLDPSMIPRHTGDGWMESLTGRRADSRLSSAFSCTGLLSSDITSFAREQDSVDHVNAFFSVYPQAWT